MEEKSCTTRMYKTTVANNGISTTFPSFNWLAGFLNHQPYVQLSHYDENPRYRTLLCRFHDQALWFCWWLLLLTPLLQQTLAFRLQGILENGHEATETRTDLGVHMDDFMASILKVFCIYIEAFTNWKFQSFGIENGLKGLKLVLQKMNSHWRFHWSLRENKTGFKSSIERRCFIFKKRGVDGFPSTFPSNSTKLFCTFIRINRGSRVHHYAQEKVDKNSDSINTYICPGYYVNNWEVTVKLVKLAVWFIQGIYIRIYIWFDNSLVMSSCKYPRSPRPNKE